MKQSFITSINTVPSNNEDRIKTYLSVIENFVNRLWDKKDLSTITTDYKEKAIGSLREKTSFKTIIPTLWNLESFGLDMIDTPSKLSALIHRPTRMLVCSLLLCKGLKPLRERKRKASIIFPHRFNFKQSFDNFYLVTSSYVGRPCEVQWVCLTCETWRYRWELKMPAHL